MTIMEIFANYYQYFLRGTRTTILISLITVFCGFLLGCVIALLRLSKNRILNGFAKLYITVLRGTPLLVQLYIVYYQLDFIPYPKVNIWSGRFPASSPFRSIPLPMLRRSSVPAFRRWISGRVRRPVRSA